MVRIRCQLNSRTIVHVIYPIRFRYDKISDDEDFPDELHKSVSYVINCMANRVQQVDFLQFVCTHLTEESAKHIHIYRKSLKAVASKNTNTDEVDFEAIFFQHEQDVDRLNTSHANVCLDENYEKSNVLNISYNKKYFICFSFFFFYVRMA